MRSGLARLGLLGLLTVLTLSGAAPAQEEPDAGSAEEELSQALDRLGPEYRRWLLSVRGLITRAELEYFLGLEQDFRRDAFMEAFWAPRDPDPRTPVNELRQRWEQYRDAAGDVPYGDPRFLALLLNGPPGGWGLPDGQPVARCFSRSRELEIWFWGGSERIDRRFLLLFLRRSTGTPYEVFRPGESLRAIQRTGRLPTTDIRFLCADELLRYALAEVSRLGDYEGIVERALSPPLPSPEWLATFKAGSTALPQGAETFPAELELSFPGRRQSRTAVQARVLVPLEEAAGRRFDGERFHHFLLVGEVIRDGRLFEGFEYRFEGPTPEGVAAIPLGFRRFLRPGPVTLRLLVEDVFGERYAQVVREVDVPNPEGLPEAREAAAAVDAERPTLELVPPPGEVHTGLVRFWARLREEVDEVSFFIDDRQVLTKRRPPYSVELDLGSEAVPRRVRAVAFAGGREVASDQVWLNQRAQRFTVHLVEPRPGGLYPGSVTARVEVHTPDGSPPEKVEILLGDELVATLDEPPYTRTLRLPDAEAAVVKAVATLTDGTSAEDAVLVNSSTFTEEIEVRLVELLVRVEDAGGKPLRGLSRESFRVYEDGAEQTIEDFEPAGEAPLTVALLVDRSSSMAPSLGEVAEAAAALAGAALASPEDRVAVYSFADRLSRDVAPTASHAEVERALAGLQGRGGTALHDALVQVANSFGEAGRGAEAVVLFSDGRDEESRLTFEQTLEAARRSGAVLYAVGLAASFEEAEEARARLETLAAETGGRAVFLEGLDDLPQAFAAILEELRAAYLLTYRPPRPERKDGFRTVRVEVDVSGAVVRTRRGYVP